MILLIKLAIQHQKYQKNEKAVLLYKKGKPC